MNTALKIGFAAVLIAASGGVPFAVQRQARLELRARQQAFEQQAGQLAHLAEENGRLSNVVAQANASLSLTAEQLRELLRLRNEKHWLAEQTNLLVRLAEQQGAPEDEGTRRERARLAQVGASLGIPADATDRFFDRAQQQQAALVQKFEDMEKSLAGTPEEKQRQMQAAMQEEINKLAIETLGDKGPALVQKMVERK
jgi:uncharacterized protein YlxW (UPF0749 family)